MLFQKALPLLAAIIANAGEIKQVIILVIWIRDDADVTMTII